MAGSLRSPLFLCPFFSIFLWACKEIWPRPGRTRRKGYLKTYLLSANLSFLPYAGGTQAEPAVNADRTLLAAVSNLLPLYSFHRGKIFRVLHNVRARFGWRHCRPKEVGKKGHSGALPPRPPFRGVSFLAAMLRKI